MLPLDTLHCSLDITSGFAEDYLSHWQVLPLALEAGKLRVAAAAAPDQEVLADLEHTFGAVADVVLVPAADLQEAIRRLFAASASLDSEVRALGAQRAVPDDGLGLTDLRDLANQPPVVRFVNLLFREAHDARASDVHLEATREGMRVRMRVDGVLTDLPSPPRPLQPAITSRLKLLAELDIAERRHPMDGRLRVRLETRDLDVRLSTVPTLFGESLVLRLLDQGGRPTSLEELGMAPDTLARFREAARRPHGIVIATGPTGSGKTTTLYAALGLRDPVTEKIITLEDPVEYELPGVTQVPIANRAGVTFAVALRSLLRQDPDVMLVGEIRDDETAAIAVQAAMTGHLVLTTMHTNDAVSAVGRLLDLGVPGFLIGATLQAVVAQRLVRRICSACAEWSRPDPTVVPLLEAQWEGRPADLHVRHGRGCGACRGTGYRGRTSISELIVMDDPLRQLVATGADAATLRATACDGGQRSLRDDAWRKVADGTTTVEEVLRVTHA